MADVTRYGQRGLRALLFFCLALLLASCQRTDQIYALSGSTMGTTWHVKVVGLPSGMTPPKLQSDIDLLLKSVNNQMSTYIKDSDLSKFNQAKAGTWHKLPPDFFHVLEYSLWLAGETGGAYDPTVGPLVNLWGFGPPKDEQEPPSPQAIKAAQNRVGYQKVKLRRDTHEAFQPGGVYLDLSSDAKGFGVDKVAEYLKARGIDNYLVEIGGELRAGGEKPGGKPWRVAVERPIPGVREADKIMDLHTIAVATSGDYRNFFRKDGKTYSHTIDPRTGYPITHHLASVTVLRKDCMEADALATALTVLGPKEGMAFARKRELPVLFIVRKDKGFTESMTPQFRKFLDREDQ